MNFEGLTELQKNHKELTNKLIEISQDKNKSNYFSYILCEVSDIHKEINGLNRRIRNVLKKDHDNDKIDNFNDKVKELIQQEKEFNQFMKFFGPAITIWNLGLIPKNE